MATNTKKKTTKKQPNTKKKKIFAGVAPKYRSPKDVQNKVDEFFDQIDKGLNKHCKYPTLSGLALHLGFSSTKWMYDYSKKSKGFKEVVSCAKTRVENCVNQMLLNPVTKNVQGPKFYLSAAYKYSEKVDTKVEGTIKTFIRYPQKKAIGADILKPDQRIKKNKITGKKK